MKHLNTILILAITIASAGCCIGVGGYQLEADGTAKIGQETAILTVIEYKTKPQRNVHSFDCQDNRIPNQAGNQLGTVEIPLSFCTRHTKDRQLYGGNFENFQFEINGKIEKFRGYCSKRSNGHDLYYSLHLGQ